MSCIRANTILYSSNWTATVWVFALAAPSSVAGQIRLGLVQTYEYDGPPPLRMPTDVAAAADGHVFVADGVADRLLHFDADGRFIKEITCFDSKWLSRPTGIWVDSGGRLWIADTGNARVIVATRDLELIRIIVPGLDATAGEEGPDITDVVVTADGAHAWLTDNDHHRLLRVRLSGGVERPTVAGMPVGGEGASVGQLRYPFQIAISPAGLVFVTDVINARVSVFTADGAPSRTISSYGVEPGQLFRPKGVACDADGRIWVSDGTLSVVQVFDQNGAFLDVARDETGRPFRFQSPMGIDIHGDHLYVAELSANRAVKLRIEYPAAVEFGKRLPDQQQDTPAKVAGRQARACTICHVEWIEPFSRGIGTLLMDAPVASEEEPFVSRSEMCLSCHDGSVGDSRRRVWQEHGHLTGIAPPEAMRVPAHLPLVNGKVACRTCHSAHTTGQFAGDISGAVFLRVQNTASELCISCHADKTRGPKLGTHPTGGMPWPVPEELIRAGAKVGPNPREITCQVCHTPHGSAYEHLLVMGTESNQLCLNCHDQMRPGMFRDGDHTEHPLTPAVSPEQKAAVEKMGTRLGPGETLICVSCHKLHDGHGDRFMLAEDLTDGRMCLACHSEKTSVLATSHDLREKFPEERNRLGMTPHSGGPCSACHLFHRYARPPEPHPIDPRGVCTTCHQDGRCAGSVTLGPVNHPGAQCTDCHDPHQTRLEHYLKAPAEELCVDCHKDQAALFGGVHDVRRDSIAWPSAAASTGGSPAGAASDRCLACHRPHGDKRSGLYRVSPVGADNPWDGACIACHPSISWEPAAAGVSAGSLTAVHPRAAIDSETHPGVSHGLPLNPTSTEGTSTLGCRTCHNPHVSPGDSAALLRIEKNESASAVCLRCHADMQAISMTAHGPEHMSGMGWSAEACGPCHSVHANPALVGEKLLSPLLRGTESAHGIAETADAACGWCHRSGGVAPAPLAVEHPAIDLGLVAGLPQSDSLPLAKTGDNGVQASISCTTCHLPHGRSDYAPHALQTRPDERAGMRLMVRPFQPPNLCTTCHGPDALRRFLYFHDPDRRGAEPRYLPAGTGSAASSARNSSGSAE